MGLLPCQPGGERGEGRGVWTAISCSSSKQQHSNSRSAGRTAARPWARWLLLWVSYPPLHSLSHPLCLLGMECCSSPTHGDVVGGWVRGGSHCGVRIDTNSSARAMDYRFIGLVVSISVVNRQSIVLQFSMTRVEKHFSRTREKFWRLNKIESR